MISGTLDRPWWFSQHPPTHQTSPPWFWAWTSFSKAHLQNWNSGEKTCFCRLKLGVVDAQDVGIGQQRLQAGEESRIPSSKDFFLTSGREFNLLKASTIAGISPSWIPLEPIFVKASLVSEVRKLDSSKPIAFADFLGLWGFLTFDDFWTDLPPPLSLIPSYSTTIWAALVDESVDELVLSIEVSGAAIFFFGLGQGLPGWTWPTLESDFFIGIATSTKRVKPQSKATGTGFWWSGYWDLDNQRTVEGYRPSCGWTISERWRATIYQADKMIVDAGVLG